MSLALMLRPPLTEFRNIAISRLSSEWPETGLEHENDRDVPQPAAAVVDDEWEDDDDEQEVNPTAADSGEDDAEDDGELLA